MTPDIKIPREVVEKAYDALAIWALYMPILSGDTIYSGHPKVMRDEALALLAPYLKGE